MFWEAKLSHNLTINFKYNDYLKSLLPRHKCKSVKFSTSDVPFPREYQAPTGLKDWNRHGSTRNERTCTLWTSTLHISYLGRRSMCCFLLMADHLGQQSFPCSSIWWHAIRKCPIVQDWWQAEKKEGACSCTVRGIGSCRPFLTPELQVWLLHYVLYSLAPSYELPVIQSKWTWNYVL